jgi:alternate signal-mediated exported protein
MNNKMIKGSVAGATGIVLLMGGFGTYALWSDSADLGGSVSSGELDLNLGGALWHDVSEDVSGTPLWDADPTGDGVTDLMVPGDTVRLTQRFTVDAAGKNLEFDVNVNGLSSETWESLGVTMTLDGEPVAPASTIDDRHYTVATNGDGQHTLQVFFDFPSTVTGDTDQDESVAVSDIEISIDQVRPAPATP